MLFAFTLIAAACGGDSDDDAASDSGSSSEDSGDDDAMEDDEDAMEDDEMEDADHADIAAVCPSPLIIQTDWFPESEHGMLYELLGDGYTVDVENLITTGPLVSGGVELGIDFEIRAGGPAIGFQPTATVMYTEDEIHLSYTNTEAQATQFADTPLIAVMAPLEINPQMVMWDPETYPDVESIADLGEAGVVVNVFGGGEWAPAFVAAGTLSEDQVDPSYDGSPARFIAEGGAIAQQGFASAEPFNYENVFEEWGKPVELELLHDAGFEVYAAQISVRAAELEELSPCLTEMVPIMQQAAVDYTNDPAETNGVIVDIVEQLDAGWVYSAELADFSIAKQIELGLVGNGDDSTLGNIDGDRVQRVLDSMTAAGSEVVVTDASELFTNEFIDDSIGL